MRVLQVTSHLNIGGISRYVLTLSSRLAARGHSVRIASGGGELEAEAAAAGVGHRLVPLHTSADFSLQAWLAARRLAQLLRREPADVVHAHTRISQVAAAHCARVVGVPYVTTWHGIFHPNLGRSLWPCTGRRTIAISEPVRQNLLATFRVPEERVRLIVNGVDPAYFAQPPQPDAVAAFRQAHGVPPRGPIIGSIGRLASGGVKGFDLVIATAARLVHDIPDLHVLIVGDGPRRPLIERLVQESGLGGQVHLTGRVADVRVPLSIMDVFVFPVRWPEGFGLSLIEAMAAGRPVVATRTGAVPGILADAGCGVLVNTDDVRALADGIAGLLRDPAFAARMGQAGQRRVRDAFSLDRMVERVEAVYREVAPG